MELFKNGVLDFRKGHIDGLPDLVDLLWCYYVS